LPLLGLHTALAVVVAAITRLPFVPMWVWTNVSNPWFLPFVFAADFAAGRWVLGSAVQLPQITGWRFWELFSAPGSLFVALFVGGLLVGSALALVVGAGTYVVSNALKKKEVEQELVEGL
jgi:uncharacterized protein (DUF2062 family)